MTIWWTTLHDGHTNKYIFFIHGKKITLLPLWFLVVNKDENIIKEEKEEKEKGQVFTKVLVAYKKSFPKQDVHHHSSSSSQTKKEEQRHKQERKSGLEK